jgi:VanZ family protein
VRKYFFLFLAILWTAFVVFLCLIRSSQIPTVSIVGIDKIVHFILHFSFTFLWGMAFYKSELARNFQKILWCSFLLSFIFGVLIEFSQFYLTTTRSGDGKDVLANSLGALLAISVLNYYFKAMNTK